MDLSTNTATIPEMFRSINESSVDDRANQAFNSESGAENMGGVPTNRPEDSGNEEIDSQGSLDISEEEAEIENLEQVSPNDIQSLIAGFNDLRSTLNTKLDNLAESFQTIVDRKVKPIMDTLHHEETGIVPKVTKIQQMSQNNLAEITALKSENQELKTKMECMVGLIQRQDAQLSILTNKMTSVISRGMENNITISGLLEDDDQQDIDLVHRFISNIMKIPVNKEDLLEVFRLGTPTLSSGEENKARLVVLKTTPQMRKVILENASSLKGKTNEKGTSYFVNLQQPDALIEKKKEIRAISKDLKEKERNLSEDKKSKLSVRYNSIYIGNKIFRKPIKLPTPKELFPSQTEQRLIDVIKFQQSDVRRDNSSTFTAFAAHVHSMTEARRFYTKIKQLHPSADHVIAAYKLATVQGYNDDFEYGAGVKILSLFDVQKIQDVITIVVRYYSGKHMGPKRFQCITEVANTAIVRLKEEDLSEQASRSSIPL